MLVTSGEVARRICAQPAYVRGMGEFHSHGYQSQADEFGVSVGAREAGRQAFRTSGLTPGDIDVVEIYDAFSAMPLICLEDLGFCGKGEGGALVESGAILPGGELDERHGPAEAEALQPPAERLDALAAIGGGGREVAGNGHRRAPVGY